jgi:septal ring factor EnvC (AmiA/AmiB activator)
MRFCDTIKKKTMKKIIKQTLKLLPVALLVAFVFMPAIARADEVTDLQTKSSALQAQITADQQKVLSLHETATTLQQKVAVLQAEIDVATNEIALTSVKLDQLKTDLENTIRDLEKQKSLLKAALRALYEKRGASTVELIMSSDSFSQYISNQEYLDRLTASIKDSTEKVVQLKFQIEEQKRTQEDLLKKQQSTKLLLGSKQQEQQALLVQTQGEETKYQAQVSAKKSELQAAEDNLQAILAERARKAQIGQPATNLGPVKRNQQVGTVGSTGFSTGPHIHFVVTQGGSSLNPRLNGGNQLVNGFSWPVPNQSWSDVSQEYGCVAPPGYYLQSCNGGAGSFHGGLDVSAWYGDPVVAAADGVIVFRGCKSGLGYIVVIDHGDGWQTWYPHMQTPGGQSSGYCNE